MDEFKKISPTQKIAHLRSLLATVTSETTVLTSDNDRLRRELEEAKAELDRLKKCLEKANANAENFEREWYLRGDALESAQSDLADMRRELEAARAELARMRPVVEAVMEYVSSGMRERWPVLRAVDAYRAGAGKGGE